MQRERERERERERDTERERHRERQRERQRQTDRQTETERERDRQTERERELKAAWALKPFVTTKERKGKTVFLFSQLKDVQTSHAGEIGLLQPSPQLTKR